MKPIKEEEVYIVKENLQNFVEINGSKHPYYMFNIFLTEEEINIGYCYYIHNADALDSLGNIGYFIEEEYRGKNYGYKACIQLLKLLRQEGIEKVYISVAKGNNPSIKICEKLSGINIGDYKNTEEHDSASNHEERTIFEIRL